MGTVVQDIVVGLLVLAAAFVVTRHVLHLLRPPRRGEGCASCELGSEPLEVKSEK